MLTVREALSNKTILVPLVLILVLGACLRFYGLGRESLWNDELGSWRRSHYDDLRTVIDKGVRPDVHPPAYQTLIYFLTKYVGDSEWILRFPSAVCGVLSIFVIFLVGLRLYTPKESLLASALMAVSWFPIYYSQEARSYSMLLLFTLMATYFWLGIVSAIGRKEKLRWPATVGYVVTAVISCYLHYFGLLIIALHCIGAMLLSIQRRQALVSCLSIYLCVGLAYVPWLPTMWTHLNRGPIWIPRPTGNPLAGYLEGIFNESKGILMLVATLYLCMLAYSLYSVRRSAKRGDFAAKQLFPAVFLVLWLTVPFTIAYIKSVISTPVLTNRNLIISISAAYLLLARAVISLPAHVLKKKALWAAQAVASIAIVSLLVSHLVFDKDYYSKPHKQQFREATEFVIEHDHLYPNSLIIACAWSKEHFDYYFQKKDSPRRVQVILALDEHIPEAAEVINNELPAYTWCMMGNRFLDDKSMDFLLEGSRVVIHKTFIDTEVWLFENISRRKTMPNT